MNGPPAPGPYLQTVSGRWVNPFDPDPGQLDPGDIARALANQCRFGGHSRVFYSVAQHSVIVSELVERDGGDAEDAFAGLMHGATEAYLGGMPQPLKHRSALGEEFKRAEDRLEEALRAHFRIRAEVPAIKPLDRALLATERREFSSVAWSGRSSRGRAVGDGARGVAAGRRRSGLPRALRRARLAPLSRHRREHSSFQKPPAVVELPNLE